LALTPEITTLMVATEITTLMVATEEMERTAEVIVDITDTTEVVLLVTVETAVMVEQEATS
jgi:hypothetical protein